MKSSARFRLHCKDGVIVSGMALRRTDVADAAVAALDFVPVHEVGGLDASGLEIGEAVGRELRTVLGGAEQRLDEGVVVLAWRVSITMDTAFCLDALDEALAKHGTPEIMNTDQGSQFTSAAFIARLKAEGVRISMDGKGSWRDNVFVERLWKSVKYEEVYLHGYDTVSAARQGIDRYFHFHNTRRPHSSLDRQTPDQVYFQQQPLPRAA